MRVLTMSSISNFSQLIHHANFLCVMILLNTLFKIKFKKLGTRKDPKLDLITFVKFFKYRRKQISCFLFLSTSYEYPFCCVLSEFTSLIMKTKYVFHGLISP